MGHTIDYAGMGPAAAADKAVKDVKRWLGAKRFNTVIKVLQGRDGAIPLGNARFMLHMIGIEGFPVEVMIERYWQPQMSLDL